MNNSISEKYIKNTKQYIDVYYELEEKKYAIEVQSSKITPSELRRRTLNYISQEIIPIWIIDQRRIKYHNNFLYTNYENIKFATNVLSNSPVLYTFDIFKKNLIVHYNLIPINKRKYYFKKKIIKINEITNEFQFNLSNINYDLRSDVTKRCNYPADNDVIGFLVTEQISLLDFPSEFLKTSPDHFFYNEYPWIYEFKKKYGLKPKKKTLPLIF